MKRLQIAIKIFLFNPSFHHCDVTAVESSTGCIGFGLSSFSFC